ncbi:MAG TPA: class I SAM-dependent methyltransferase [Solirubrobacteraceae bacterium]|nr:class I SAM-dependent methyltransferase [Solirubrobacteraceae bacterium]
MSSVADDPPAPGFAEVLARLEGVAGWLTEAQARCLWDAAGDVRAGGRIVEIGSFRGRSTIVLASAADPGVEVVAIDPHGGGDRGPQEISPDAARGEEDFAAFRANLQRAGVEDRVRHVRLPSDAARHELYGPIDLLYVDGAHRYRPARADIEHWGAGVTPGGALLIHDSFNAIGVMLAQLRLLVFSRGWRYHGRHGSLAVYRREPQPLDASAMAVNAARQLAGLAYFARNMCVKVALVAHARPVARLLGHGDEPWPY